MRYIKIFLFVTAILVSISAYGQHVEDDFSKLAWLEGAWISTNSKAGTTVTEKWVKESPTKMLGTGVTLKGADTAFVEKMQLIIKDGIIYFVADVKDNTAPVSFKLTSLTTYNFVCENPEHDFPKKIAYNLTDGILKATISGNGKAIDYTFVKGAIK